MSEIDSKKQSRQKSDVVVIERAELQHLLDAIARQGYQVIGPTVRDKTIVYDVVSSVEEFPIGWTDEQDGGRYRLTRREDEALFGYVLGPRSWKHFLHPPRQRLWSAGKKGRGFELKTEEEPTARYAFFGARPCELKAIAIQDKVFFGGEYPDPAYQRRREQIFTVVVNCTNPGGTCFCTSMNTGPRASDGYDIAMTEILEKDRHFFVTNSGSDKGAGVLSDISSRPATPDEIAQAADLVETASGRMGRSMNTGDVHDLLADNPEHPRWDDVASRCLSCSNCTMACPTCFCITVEDRTSLNGDSSERWRRWDSCFTVDFSYIHGGSVRPSPGARYRHWITHHLSPWVDQFGSFGCVGCGRCITWCPVGIDITEEVKAIRGDSASNKVADTQTEETNG